MRRISNSHDDEITPSHELMSSEIDNHEKQQSVVALIVKLNNYDLHETETVEITDFDLHETETAEITAFNLHEVTAFEKEIAQ